MIDSDAEFLPSSLSKQFIKVDFPTPDFPVTIIDIFFNLIEP